MYEDLRMLAQSIFREFEDLKRKLISQNAPKEEISRILNEITSRLPGFNKYNVRKVNEFTAEVQLLKKRIEENKQPLKLLTELQERIRILRDRSLAADQKEEIMKEFALE